MVVRIFRLLPVISLLMLLGGCLDVEHHYILNPNGSGKLIVDARITDWGIEANDKDIDNQLRQAVKGYLDSTEGVDTWKDVSYEMDGDKVHFIGTAYFSDVSKLKSTPLGMENLTFEQQGNGDRVFKIDLNTNSKFNMSSTSTDEPGTSRNEPLTEDQIRQQIDSMKTVFGMMRDMMGMMLETYRVRSSVRVPSTVKEMTGFVPSVQGDPLFDFQGKKMLSMLDSLVADTLMIRRMVQTGDSTEMGQRMLKIAFPNGEPRIVFAGNALPLFDYQAEVAAATPAYARLLHDLGVPKKTAPKSKRKKV